MEGTMGRMLDWYPVIRAARYLGVPPWELLDQPIFWQHKALAAEIIDEQVSKELAKRDAPDIPNA
jgi:hypothetical protein